LITTGTGVGVAALAVAAALAVLLEATVALVLAAVLLAATVALVVVAALCAAVLVGAVVAADVALATEAAVAIDELAAVPAVVTVADPPQAARRPTKELVANRDKQVRRDNRTAFTDSSFAIEKRASTLLPEQSASDRPVIACSLV
jgi:endonuclease/exonuclease/phosphatase (EEP) superfamily protein YafD